MLVGNIDNTVAKNPAVKNQVVQVCHLLKIHRSGGALKLDQSNDRAHSQTYTAGILF